MKRIDRVVCPLCAHSKVIDAPAMKEKGEVIWVKFNSKSAFIQIREGGGKVGTGKTGRGHGRGYGFPMVGSLTLDEAMKVRDYDVIVTDMASNLVNLVKECRKRGLITDADLE